MPFIAGMCIFVGHETIFNWLVNAFKGISAGTDHIHGWRANTTHKGLAWITGDNRSPLPAKQIQSSAICQLRSGPAGQLWEKRAHLCDVRSHLRYNCEGRDRRNPSSERCWRICYRWGWAQWRSDPLCRLLAALLWQQLVPLLPAGNLNPHKH